MHFLIVSRISIPAKDRTIPCWQYLRSLGHTVTVEHPDSVPVSQRPDVIISWGVSVMEESFRALERWPGVLFTAMNWDVYEGILKNPRPRTATFAGEPDYQRYGELLKRATEVWVPSACTGRRTTQWYGLANWHVILSACPWWDYDCPHCGGGGMDGRPLRNAGPCAGCNGTGSGVRDDGYALMCLREIPDPWWGMFEKCCEELGIPYKTTRHEVSYEAYQDAVAGCRFICAPLYELSTGGLSLMEAYYHGKPCLISDSPWNGGVDYMGIRGHYFKYGDVEDFKQKLRWMHDHYRYYSLNQHECRDWIKANFSDRRMVDDILARLKVHGILQ